MRPVRIPDLDELLLTVLATDHPEITAVERTSKAVDDPTYHTRVKVSYASDAASYVMVHHVTGPGVPGHAPYDLPPGA